MGDIHSYHPARDPVHDDGIGGEQLGELACSLNYVCDQDDKSLRRPACALVWVERKGNMPSDGEFRNAVDGKQWTELDQTLIGRRSDVLSFMEPKHFVAVLPAFLRSLVEDGTKTSAPDTLVLVLDRDSEPRFDKIAKHLNADQRAVVIEALELFATSTSGQPAEAARHAIESWRGK